MASRDPEIDSFFSNYRKKLPWETGENNWIYPVTTSVSGNKSDRYIEREYTLSSKQVSGCLYENVFQITHRHVFSSRDHDQMTEYMRAFSLREDEAGKKMRFIQ